MSWRNFTKGQLWCPHCEYDGTSCPVPCGTGECDCAPFSWVEDEPVFWPIHGIAVENIPGDTCGTIVCSDECVHDGDSSNPRIVCHCCNGEFPVPKTMCADWSPDGSYLLESASNAAYSRALDMLKGGGEISFFRASRPSRGLTIAAGTRARIVTVSLDEVILSIRGIKESLDIARSLDDCRTIVDSIVPSAQDE